MKIIHDKVKCIGCGACASLCSDHFKMGEDGKAHLLDSKTENQIIFELEVKEAGCAKAAASACPVQCIKIEK